MGRGDLLRSTVLWVAMLYAGLRAVFLRFFFCSQIENLHVFHQSNKEQGLTFGLQLAFSYLSNKPAFEADAPEA